MHTAKCERCEREVEFQTYRHDWPTGWVLTGKSRWGKTYHRRSGWAWWCPDCDAIHSHLPRAARRALGLIDGLRERVAELEAQVVRWQRKHAGLYESFIFEQDENRELREQLTTAKLRAAGYKRQWLRVKGLLENQD